LRQRQQSELGPGANPDDVSAYMPAGIGLSPDFVLLTLRQKHAIADITDRLMWFSRIGKFAIVTRKFKPPLVITPNGELAPIHWQAAV
jgi:hypothetical protein